VHEVIGDDQSDGGGIYRAGKLKDLQNGGAVLRPAVTVVPSLFFVRGRALLVQRGGFLPAASGGAPGELRLRYKIGDDSDGDGSQAPGRRVGSGGCGSAVLRKRRGLSP
jgi:hypothetical protein